MAHDALYDRLETLVAQTSLEISPEQLQQLVGYVQLLHKWNKAYNLTSVRDPQEMLIKHIMDSLMVQPYFEAKRCIDVGTGPGLPGIPLAIIQPHMHFTLLDSLGKRIRFIKQALFELGIHNAEAVQSRVELFRPDEGYDVVISRAFASMKDMLHWCQHLLKEKSGVYFALKGQIQEQEIADLPDNISVDKIHLLSVPELVGERHLVVLSHKISE